MTPMQRPLYGLATGLTPFAVEEPALGDASIIQRGVLQRQIVAAASPAAKSPLAVRTRTDPRVLMVQQRSEFVVLRIALVGFLAMAMAWLTVAQRPAGSSTLASPRDVPDANPVATASTSVAHPLPPPIHLRMERPGSTTDVAPAASASNRAAEAHREVPAEPLASTLERLGAGLR